MPLAPTHPIPQPFPAPATARIQHLPTRVPRTGVRLPAELGQPLGTQWGHLPPQTWPCWGLVGLNGGQFPLTTPGCGVQGSGGWCVGGQGAGAAGDGVEGAGVCGAGMMGYRVQGCRWMGCKGQGTGCRGIRCRGTGHRVAGRGGCGSAGGRVSETGLSSPVTDMVMGRLSPDDTSCPEHSVQYTDIKPSYPRQQSAPLAACRICTWTHPRPGELST